MIRPVTRSSDPGDEADDNDEAEPAPQQDHEEEEEQEIMEIDQQIGLHPFETHCILLFKLRTDRLLLLLSLS